MVAWLHETRTLIFGTVEVVVFFSVGSELYCCSWDGYIATCACHEGTGVHVHAMRGHIY